MRAVITDSVYSVTFIYDANEYEESTHVDFEPEDSSRGRFPWAAIGPDRQLPKPHCAQLPLIRQYARRKAPWQGDRALAVAV